MKVDRSTLERTAHLSRLYFDEKDERTMLADLNGMVEWVGQLDEVDTEGVAPLTYMTEEVNVLRQDEPKTPLDHESGLKNAPKRDSDYFRVPRVVDEGE